MKRQFSNKCLDHAKIFSDLKNSVTPLELPADIRAHMVNKIEEKFAYGKRLDSFVTVFFPFSSLVYHLGHIIPRCKGSYFFSHLESSYLVRWSLVWQFSDAEMLSSILGPRCFMPRSYPDSTGTVDHENRKGGRLELYINQSHPVFLSYDTFLQELTISFNFRAYKMNLDTKIFEEIM